MLPSDVERQTIEEERDAMLFADINKGVDRAGRTKGAVLIDVLEADEYAAGHIPGTVNVPVDNLGCIEYGKEMPLFLYCLSGVRSLKAAFILKRMGFGKARSIGGISGYRGTLEK